MSKMFADRGIVSVAGREVFHIQNVTVDVNLNAQRVETMNKKRRTAGHTRGNKHVTVTFATAVEERNAQAYLEGMDYELLNVDITVVMGGEKYTAKNIFCTQWGTSASGQGSEVQKNWNFEAEDLVNENNSSLTDQFIKGAQSAQSATGALGL